MTKQLRRDLDNLNREILSLSAQVEEMIDRASRALCDGDASQVVEVVQADYRVDESEVLIEEDCLNLLALHHPVATDLRQVATVMKVNNDLERIGDLAVSVVERAEGLHLRPDFPIPLKLKSMFAMASNMVRDALNAFVDGDAEAARDVCQRDNEVDQANRDVIAELQSLMESRQEMVGPALHCFSASRHLERIADHATNIAEDVVYLVEGEIIRHRERSLH